MGRAGSGGYRVQGAHLLKRPNGGWHARRCLHRYSADAFTLNHVRSRGPLAYPWPCTSGALPTPGGISGWGLGLVASARCQANALDRCSNGELIHRSSPSSGRGRGDGQRCNEAFSPLRTVFLFRVGGAGKILRGAISI